MDAARGPTRVYNPRPGGLRRGGRDAVLVAGRGCRLPWPAEDSPSGLWRSPGTRVGLTALAGSNPASSALSPGCGPPGRTPGTTIEEAYGPHRCGDLARVVLPRRRCPLLLLRAAPNSGTDGSDVAHAGHGDAHRHRRPDRSGRAAGGVHAAAHPQARVRHPCAGAEAAHPLDRPSCTGRRTDHRRGRQRDLAVSEHGRAMAVRYLRRRGRCRRARDLRFLPGLRGRAAPAAAQTGEGQAAHVASRLEGQNRGQRGI